VVSGAVRWESRLPRAAPLTGCPWSSVPPRLATFLHWQFSQEKPAASRGSMPAPREVVIVVWEIQQSVARVQFVWLRVRRLVCVELTHPLKETKSHRDGAMTLTFGPC